MGGAVYIPLGQPRVVASGRSETGRGGGRSETGRQLRVRWPVRGRLTSLTESNSLRGRPEAAQPISDRAFSQFNMLTLTFNSPPLTFNMLTLTFNMLTLTFNMLTLTFNMLSMLRSFSRFPVSQGVHVGSGVLTNGITGKRDNDLNILT